MKILGIVGSKRKSGNTASLVKRAINSAKRENIKTEIIYLGDYDIKGCYGCEHCQKAYKCIIKDDMQELYKKILEADAIIAGTPTYFYNVSSDMKAFIERLYCFEVFDDEDRSVWMSVNEALGGKLAVTISVCEQNSEADMGVTSEVMDLSFKSLGYRIIESVKILNLFEENDAASNEVEMTKAIRAGEKLAKTILLKEKIQKNINNII